MSYYYCSSLDGAEKQHGNFHLLDEEETASILLELSQQGDIPHSRPEELGAMEDIGNSTITVDEDVEPGKEKAAERRKSIVKAAKRKSDFEVNNSHLRLQGQVYKGVKRTKDGTEIVEKESKTMGEGCAESAKCRRFVNTFGCKKITLKQRSKVWSDFWRLESWESKRVMLKGMIQREEPRRADLSSSSSRTNSFKYFLPSEDGPRVRVCAKMFSDTYGIPLSTIQDWMRDPKPKSAATNKPPQQNRRRAQDTKKQQDCSAFLDSLPKTESHYCRQQDDRLYLERHWTSKRDLYRQATGMIK